MTPSSVASLATIALTAGLSALSACISSAALANDLVIPKAVLAIAHAATVRIDTPGSPGSGVVIRNERDSCTLLSAYHVAASIQEKEAGDVLFRSGQSLPLRRDMIARVGQTDFAILKIPNSCPVGRVAVLANPNDVLIGDRVFVGGFSANISPEVHSASYRVVGGRLLSVSEQLDGYSLTYDVDTVSGMSGGPIFSPSGLLIGIHGRGETLGNTGQKIAGMGMSVRLALRILGQTSGGFESLPSIQPLRSSPCPGVIC